MLTTIKSTCVVMYAKCSKKNITRWSEPDAPVLGPPFYMKDEENMR